MRGAQVLPLTFGLSVLLLSCALTVAGPVKDQTDALKETRECHTIGVATCEDLDALEDCTVILGRLIFFGFYDTWDGCDINNVSFPKLREITDYLIFYKVNELRSFATLLPNLQVIRGRSLYLNYALGITDMDDLETLAFPSLIAIQRGQILVNRVPKLCDFGGMDFDALTSQHPSQNVLEFPTVPNKYCAKAQKAPCPESCAFSCWTSSICPHPEHINGCNEQCLGNCNIGESPEGCNVCRGWTSNGTCVESCPPDSYKIERFQRCYNLNGCIQQGFLLHEPDQTCVRHCPSGFKANMDKHTCEQCAAGEACINVCGPLYIYNMEDLSSIRGCEVVNGSLSITLRSKVKMSELETTFEALRIIDGYLRIFKNEYLESLQFLSNLRAVNGKELENNISSLVIFDNPRLRDLWDVKNDTFKQGTFFMQRNNKLCNGVIEEFLRKENYTSDRRLIQESDEEVLCGPPKLAIELQTIGHRGIELSWAKDKTNERVEIVYRPAIPGRTYEIDDDGDLGESICRRIEWTRILLFRSELQSYDAKHYKHELLNLKPNTRYAIVMRTFGEQSTLNGRSKVQFLSTQLDVPTPPKVQLSKKTETSLEYELLSKDEGQHEDVQQYFVDVLSHNSPIERDFCQNSGPLATQTDDELYDYDRCCERHEEAQSDQLFQAKISELYKCTRDHGAYCAVHTTKPPGNAQRLIFKPEDSRFVIENLEPARQYALEVSACNAHGCSNPYVLVEMTNYTLPKPSFKACRRQGNVYVVHIPQGPNIQAYDFYFKPDEEPDAIRTLCQHVNRDSTYLLELDINCTRLKVRAISHVGSISSSWKSIKNCPNTAKTPHNTAHPTETIKFASHLLFWIIAVLLVALAWLGYRFRPFIAGFRPFNGGFRPWYRYNRRNPSNTDIQLLHMGNESEEESRSDRGERQPVGSEVTSTSVHTTTGRRQESTRGQSEPPQQQVVPKIQKREHVEKARRPSQQQSEQERVDSDSV